MLQGLLPRRPPSLSSVVRQGGRAKLSYRPNIARRGHTAQGEMIVNRRTKVVLRGYTGQKGRARGRRQTGKTQLTAWATREWVV